MKRLLFILFLTISFLTTKSQQKVDFGKVVLNPNFNYFESFTDYVPNDCFITSEFNITPAKVSKKEDGSILIENSSDVHSIKFIIDKELNIKDVKFNLFSDLVIPGASEVYTVENIIMCLDQNPFSNDYFSGYYTMKIKSEYFAGEIMEKKAAKDTVDYSVYNGKFKICSDIEIKNGIDWIKGQNEIKLGVKDSLGIYEMPEVFASFILGDSIFNKTINDFVILKSELINQDLNYINVSFVVDEKGKVDTKSIQIKNSSKEDKILEKVRNYDVLWNNWLPAKYNNSNVKSKLNINFRVKS
jgi:predicted esterase YcpF (UPF0227 family)